MVRNNLVIQVLFVFFALIFLTSCGNGEENTDSNQENNSEVDQTEEVEQDEEQPEPEPEEPQEPETIKTEISIAAVGDMLIHNSIYEDAKTADGFDFTPMLEKVKPYLEDATITIANQETMIGGVELGLSSYPAFNSPHEVGDALHDAGVDVVTLANNHTLDRGEEAIQSALAHWETIDMMYTGAYQNQEDSQVIRVLHTEEDIDVAFLSYTYGTNGIPVPEGKDYLVNLIDKDKIATDIEASKEMADVIVLSLHFGNEYERMPNDEQKELVQFAADQGVHAVIGHHPHVLQPIDWVEGKDGNQTLVAYSLGNFISAQEPSKIYRHLGGMVKFTVEKETKGEEESIQVKSPQFLPTYVNFENWRNFEIIPMHQVTDAELPNANAHFEEIKSHMSQWVPELEFIEAE